MAASLAPGPDTVADPDPSTERGSGPRPGDAADHAPPSGGGESVSHHPSAQRRGRLDLVAGVEEDLQQPDRRLVPDHGLPRWRVALEDADVDLPAVLDDG